jgi:hypothetical protein
MEIFKVWKNLKINLSIINYKVQKCHGYDNKFLNVKLNKIYNIFIH